jgi:hypothetical protein
MTEPLTAVETAKNPDEVRKQISLGGFGHKSRASSGAVEFMLAKDRYLHKVVKGVDKKVSDFDFDPEAGDEPPSMSSMVDRDTVYYQDPKGKRILLVDGKLKRISEIDTAAETFRARLHYYLTWLATEEEVEEYLKSKLPRYNKKGKDWEPAMVPNLTLLNYVDGEHEADGGCKVKKGSTFKNVTKMEISNPWPQDQVIPKSSWDLPPEAIGFDPRQGYWLRMKFEVDASCAEELELEFFPFDCQDFGIHFQCPENLGKMDLLPFPRAGCFFSVDARFSMVGEWIIPGVVIEFFHGAMSKTGKPYAMMTLLVKAERKWHTNLANLMVTFCMYFLGLGMFAIAPDDVGDRLGYAMTLVLADVATLQLMFDSMPSIPYETFMDIYMYGCFGFLVVMTVYSCGAGWQGDNRLSYNADARVFLGFTAAFILQHVFFGIYIWWRRKREKSKLWMTSSEIQAYYHGEDWFESDSVTEIPRCELSWDSAIMLHDDTNEISAKDFPLALLSEKEELAAIEVELAKQKSRSTRASMGA